MATYPQWAVNGTTGVVGEVTNSVEAALAKTVAWPEKEIFFSTKAAADAYSNTIPGHVTNGIPGLTPAAQSALNTATAPVAAATTIPDFLTRLEEPQTWLRVAEVILGGILLIVAIKGMMDPITKPVTNSIKSGAGTAVKAGAFF